MESLHPLEVNVLKTAKKVGKVFTVEELSKRTTLKIDQVRKGLRLLKDKNFVEEKIVEEKVVKPNKLTIKYSVKGLPEKQLLKKVLTSGESVTVLRTGFDREEFNATLGLLKKKGFIKIDKGEVSITSEGRSFYYEEGLSEKIVNHLVSSGGRGLRTFPVEERRIVEELVKRGLVDLVVSVTRYYSLTDKGRKVSVEDVEGVGKVTSELIKNYNGEKFRPYDVNAPVKTLVAGKKHPYKKFLDNVRNKLVALGFKEMRGNLVENEFWDLDALFMPQFHSARDIHDAYYVEEPELSKPINKKIFRRVKKVHEEKWCYKFSEEKSRRVILRTQGTALSARMLASNPSIPGKYFSIAKCFRYDVIDQTHLPDFYQVEGIILSEDNNFKKLLGVLKSFAEEFANTNKVRFRPGYFPFTEPSVEVFAEHPEIGWMELGGAGIFRREVTEPLGVNVPVIAWGLGIDRFAMLSMNTKDIRRLYSDDLRWLREAKVI